MNSLWLSYCTSVVEQQKLFLMKNCNAFLKFVVIISMHKIKTSNVKGRVRFCWCVWFQISTEQKEKISMQISLET